MLTLAAYILTVIATIAAPLAVGLLAYGIFVREAEDHHAPENIAKRDDRYLIGLLSVRENYPASRCERGSFHKGGITL